MDANNEGDAKMDNSPGQRKSAEAVQRSYFVVTMTLRFNSMDEVRGRAVQDLLAHLTRSRELHDQGVLLMAGVFHGEPDEPLTTMGILVSREAAEDYTHNDPFVLSRTVLHWELREWANMFA
ncbi:MAG: hypothetical protein ABI130_05985 [Leifsonia sp.]